VRRRPPALSRVPLLAATTLVLAGCGTIPAQPLGSSPTPAASPSASSSATARGTATPEKGSGTCEYTVTGEPARPVTPPSADRVPTSGTVRFLMKMTEGQVTLTLDRNRAPCTVHSFESLVDQGFYNNTRCHRLSDSGLFLLQCGDPTATGSGGPGYTFADETDGTEKYPRGTVAMANAGPNTNGSQFFLVWNDTALPPEYTVFGTIDAKSRDVIAGIASQGQDGSNGDGTGRPNSPAKIESVQRG
jgi:cyclophilin family peptidyl-prolyl cis-trans isomerase